MTVASGGTVTITITEGEGSNLAGFAEGKALQVVKDKAIKITGVSEERIMVVDFSTIYNSPVILVGRATGSNALNIEPMPFVVSTHRRPL